MITRKNLDKISNIYSELISKPTVKSLKKALRASKAQKGATCCIINPMYRRMGSIPCYNCPFDLNGKDSMFMGGEGCLLQRLLFYENENLPDKIPDIVLKSIQLLGDVKVISQDRRKKL